MKQDAKIPRGFLLLMGIGDAYGMKREFVPHEQNATADDLFYGPHPKFTDYKPGHYTDDTQMALANAELISARAASLSTITATDFVKAWLEAFKRDPHLGYSKRMWKMMTESKDAAGFINGLDASQGVTSGAAMRAGPLGLLADVEVVKSLTTLQARVTHDTQAGINSALAVSLTVHFLHHGGTRAKLPAFLEKHICKDWDSNENGNSDDPNNGLRSVVFAMNAFREAKTLSEVLLNAVNQNAVSDTDTVCSLAMIMASRCPEIKNDLPVALYDGLEKGRFGRDYLMGMDARLVEVFPVSKLYNKAKPSARHNTPKF